MKNLLLTAITLCFGFLTVYGQGISTEKDYLSYFDETYVECRNEFLNSELIKETGVLLIHGMNPYGFKYVINNIS